MAHVQLLDLFARRNSAAWVLEAYSQLQIWTAAYHGIYDLQAPELSGIAPVGRYGWRFVIERVLPRTNDIEAVFLGRPSPAELSTAFTLLFLMYAWSENSNLLHHFHGRYGADVYIDFDRDGDFEVRLNCSLGRRGKSQLSSDGRYLHKLIDYASGLAPTIFEPNQIGTFLQHRLPRTELGFGPEEIERLFVTFRDVVIKNDVYAAVLPRPYLADWLASESGLPIAQVNAILTLILLNPMDAPAPRDFLIRSQPTRMINRAGVCMPLPNHRDLIYGPQVVNMPEVVAANEHVIIGLPMFDEWKKNFSERIIHGRRPDLKERPLMRSVLEQTEELYHKDIFENAVAQWFRAAGCKTRSSIKEVRLDGVYTPLPCGEIDVLAYEPSSELLLVIECKALGGARDFRGYAQEVADHSRQKKYHQKMIGKLSWIRTNLQRKQDLSGNGDTIVGSVKGTGGLFVTKWPSAIRLWHWGYPVRFTDEVLCGLKHDPNRFISKLVARTQ
jgi:Holliday junction resolvase-like predicted endonuclease